ncbi:MAG: hypothetical protein J6Z43_00725 [Clostridiales bacterium]|nr:hypothetical protein [Clostridiales bacterium]
MRTYYDTCFDTSKSGRTPFEFEALLLFALPFAFTFAKFVEFATSRSHQFARSRVTL